MTVRRDRWLLISLVLIAFALRATWALSRPRDDASLKSLPDQLEYVTLARGLLAGSGLRLFDARFNQTVLAHRAPGLPAFYAALGGSITAIRLAQSAIDASAVAAVFLTARRLLSDRVAWLAAGLVAFNPFLVFFAATLLSEPLYTAMLSWSMWLFVRSNRVPRGATSGWVGAVGLTSLAALVRPSGLMLPAILGGVARRGSLGSRVVWVAAAAVLTLAIFTPWIVRNARVLRAPIITTTNDGLTLYDGLHPGADGRSDQSFLDPMTELNDLSEVERSRELSRRAIAAALGDPARVLNLAAVKVGRMWSPVPLSDAFGSRRNQWIGAAYALPVYVLVVVTLFRRVLRRSDLLLLVTPALWFTLIHAISVGSLRYRMPMEPQLAIFAGAALHRASPREEADPQ